MIHSVKTPRDLINYLVSKLKIDKWKNANCVFILSTGRTGTELLAKILGTSSSIMAFHEPKPQLINERKKARTDLNDNKELYRDIFTVSRGRMILNACIKNKIYAETSARMTFFAPVIYELMPNSKFIYIHRHPAEVIRSGMRRRWYLGHPADFGRIEPVPGEEIYKDWEQLDSFTKICWYWNTYNEFAINFRSNIEPNRIMTLKASEIYSGSAVRPIFDFIGVASPDSGRIDQIIATKPNKQLTGEFPKFEEWSESQKLILNQFTGATLQKLGYKA